MARVRRATGIPKIQPIAKVGKVKRQKKPKEDPRRRKKKKQAEKGPLDFEA